MGKGFNFDAPQFRQTSTGLSWLFLVVFLLSSVFLFLFFLFLLHIFIGFSWSSIDFHISFMTFVDFEGFRCPCDALLKPEERSCSTG